MFTLLPTTIIITGDIYLLNIYAVIMLSVGKKLKIFHCFWSICSPIPPFLSKSMALFT